MKKNDYRLYQLEFADPAHGTYSGGRFRRGSEMPPGPMSWQYLHGDEWDTMEVGEARPYRDGVLLRREA